MDKRAYIHPDWTPSDEPTKSKSKQDETKSASAKDLEKHVTKSISDLVEDSLKKKQDNK